jgi:hypothetical protein
MHACREAVHQCAETYQWCTDNGVPSPLTEKPNRLVFAELHRDISLVHTSNARLHREMSGMRKLMRRPHTGRSCVHEA